MDIYPTSTRTPGEGRGRRAQDALGMWAPCPRQLFDNLEYFQGFDDVKIYYDNGQRTIAHALHRAMDFALAKNAVVYRAAVPENYRLSQAADYICTMELVALRYRDGEPSATDEKFFGSWSQFKKGILREMRAKRV